MSENLLEHIELFKTQKEEKPRAEKWTISFDTHNRIYFVKSLMEEILKGIEDIPKSVPIYIGCDTKNERIAITTAKQPEGQPIMVNSKSGYGSAKKFINQYGIHINNKEKYRYIGTQEEWFIFDKVSE